MNNSGSLLVTVLVQGDWDLADNDLLTKQVKNASAAVCDI